VSETYTRTQVTVSFTLLVPGSTAPTPDSLAGVLSLSKIPAQLASVGIVSTNPTVVTVDTIVTLP
jgi:hypothetical protein